MPKKGEYFITSEGEYSDYCVGNFYKSIEEFSFIEKVKDFLIITPHTIEDIEYIKNGFRFPKYGNNRGLEEKFFQFLVETEVIKLIQYEEYHTGSYGDFEIQD
jgi:hypothetical protein